VVEEAGVEASGEVHANGETIYRLFVEGRVEDEPLIEAMTFCFAGWREEEVRAFASDLFREAVAPAVYETTAQLLQELRRRGHRIVAVTGSPRLLVEEALRELGLDPRAPGGPRVLGVDLARTGQLLEDRVLPPLTWGPGKVEALGRVLEGEQPAVAFGDGLGDLPMLETAFGLRVLVHPRPGLRRAAEERSGPWCVLAPLRTASGQLVVPPHSDRMF
jgi:phosphoserine phosphatase